jgi:uncharacterized protein DUF927
MDDNQTQTKSQAKTPSPTLPDPMNVSAARVVAAFHGGESGVVSVRVLCAKLKNLPRPTKEDLAEYADAKVPFFAWQQAIIAPFGIDSRPYKTEIACRLLDDEKNSLVKRLRTMNTGAEARGIYFVVNGGGQKKEQIIRFNAFFFEFDDKPLEQQWDLAMSLPIAPHIIIATRNSLHCYWLAQEGTTGEEWGAVQRTLIVALSSDPAIRDRSRVMRLPGFDHTTFDFETGQVSRVPVTVLKFDVSERLTAERMLAMLAQSGQAEMSKAEFDAWLKARNGSNKQRVKVRRERERKGAAVERVYTGDPPAGLQKVFSDICARLTIIGPSGNAQRATCPCCEDPSPSLIVELEPDKILMMCHAGCAFEEICEAIRIERKHCFKQEKVKRREAEASAEADDDGPEDPSIPRGFIIAPDGAIQSFTDTDDKPLFVCSTLRVLAHTRAGDSTSWGKLLEWQDYDQVTHTWAMEMDELAGDGKDWLKRLMAEGLRVGSSRRAKERLSDFLDRPVTRERSICGVALLITVPGVKLKMSGLHLVVVKLL